MAENPESIRGSLKTRQDNITPGTPSLRLVGIFASFGMQPQGKASGCIILLSNGRILDKECVEIHTFVIYGCRIQKYECL
jgi:hypothetical protein